MTDPTLRSDDVPPPQPSGGIYPVLTTRDVARTAAFWRELLDLRATFESDWYVSLAARDASGGQLAVLAVDHESLPASHRALPRGVVVTMERDDADAVYARAAEMGVEIVVPLRDEPWGQRHFIGVAPDGVLVDVVRVIAPSPEFLARYTARP